MTLPLEITRLVHSYLPTTDELFAEQRMRHLIKNAWLVNDFDKESKKIIFTKNAHFKICLQADICRSIDEAKRCFEQLIEAEWILFDNNLGSLTRKVHIHTEDELTPENICMYLDMLRQEIHHDFETLKKKIQYVFESADNDETRQDAMGLCSALGNIHFDFQSLFGARETHATQRHDGTKMFVPIISAIELDKIIK